MNRIIGFFASLISFIALLCYAASIAINKSVLVCLSSILFALSFSTLMCAYASRPAAHAKAAGNCAIAFGVMFASINVIVNYIQLTVVLKQPLDGNLMNLLNFWRLDLMFNLNMLSYCLMSIAAFFAAFTITLSDKADKWLKVLLMIHGIYAIVCFAIPVLGCFLPDMPRLLPPAILGGWLLYFSPITVLSMRHFRH